MLDEQEKPLVRKTFPCAGSLTGGHEGRPADNQLRNTLLIEKKTKKKKTEIGTYGEASTDQSSALGEDCSLHIKENNRIVQIFGWSEALEIRALHR
jgi:hypothetical protein